MSDPVTSNLGLTIPTGGSTPGAVNNTTSGSYPFEWKENLEIIDSECFSLNNPVPTAGILINADLSMHGWSLVAANQLNASGSNLGPQGLSSQGPVSTSGYLSAQTITASLDGKIGRNLTVGGVLSASSYLGLPSFVLPTNITASNIYVSGTVQAQSGFFVFLTGTYALMTNLTASNAALFGSDLVVQGNITGSENITGAKGVFTFLTGTHGSFADITAITAKITAAATVGTTLEVANNGQFNSSLTASNLAVMSMSADPTNTTTSMIYQTNGSFGTRAHIRQAMALGGAGMVALNGAAANIQVSVNGAALGMSGIWTITNNVAPSGSMIFREVQVIAPNTVELAMLNFSGNAVGLNGGTSIIVELWSNT